jgi:3-deoxy-D-manno-octulosonic-acid transferase
MLLQLGAAREVADAGGLAAGVVALFADPQERRRIGHIGRAVVDANRGSVARLIELIEPEASRPAARPSASH